MTGTNGRKRSDLGSSITILLVDSSSNIEEIQAFKDQQIKIITFDYESHKILSKRNVEHEISDDYITITDLQTIQKKSYVLTEWFTEPSLKDLVEYEGINLGKLLHVEFTYFLIKFLKKLLECQQIFIKNKNAVFLAAPDIFDIINSFTPSQKLGGIQTKFHYDSIEMTLQINNKPFTLKLSHSTYERIKRLSDKLTNLFFEPQLKPVLSKKSVLFVEFDVIKFKNFFSSVPQSSVGAILFNRRRPSIWNAESFSLIRKSGCKIITANALETREIIEPITNQTNIIEKQLDSLHNHDDFFKSFFVIEGLVFWNIIKPVFISLLKKRVHEYVREIFLAKLLLQKYNFSSIVVWSETGITEQIIIRLAKKLKIPIILIQHGLFYDTDEAYDMNKFQSVFPSEVDAYVVWGNLEAEHAIKHGVPKEKIKPLGSLQYDLLAKTNPQSSNENFILIATSGFNKEEVQGLTINTHEKYMTVVKKICQITSKLNKKVVIKLHPSSDELDVDELTNDLGNEVRIVKSGNIGQLIRACDVMIMIDLTTPLVEAQLCGKPVISVSVKNWWGIPTAFGSNYCINTDVDNLENLLSKVLHDNDFKQELIKNGKKFVDKYISNQGQASNKILHLLSNT